jgi:hypothetical protein
VPGAPHAGACRTKRCILTTNYEQKSRRDAPAINSTKKLSLFEVPYSEPTPEHHKTACVRDETPWIEEVKHASGQSQ